MIKKKKNTGKVVSFYVSIYFIWLMLKLLQKKKKKIPFVFC